MLAKLKSDAPELIEPFKQALWGKNEYFKNIDGQMMKQCQDYGKKSSRAFDSIKNY